jgi:hypothetical protein
MYDRGNPVAYDDPSGFLFVQRVAIDGVAALSFASAGGSTLDTAVGHCTGAKDNRHCDSADSAAFDAARHLSGVGNTTEKIAAIVQKGADYSWVDEDKIYSDLNPDAHGIDLRSPSDVQTKIRALPGYKGYTLIGELHTHLSDNALAQHGDRDEYGSGAYSAPFRVYTAVWTHGLYLQLFDEQRRLDPKGTLICPGAGFFKC